VIIAIIQDKYNKKDTKSNDNISINENIDHLKENEKLEGGLLNKNQYVKKKDGN